MPGEGEPAAKSDEEILAYTIGELEPLASPIVVVDYDCRWPLLFEVEAARIREAIPTASKLLEHAGSTSVPELPAKPVIDIVLGVPDSSNEAAYVPALERAGYVLRVREPDWFQHRLLKRPGADVNLHVFSVGCTEIEQMLLFRDWLRAHPEERALYAARKRELARQTWRFVQNYADAKSEVVHEILARARLGRRAGAKGAQK